jgi:hypothetical protein
VRLRRAPRARRGRRTDGAVAGWVNLARQVQRVRGRQVRVGRRDRQDDGVVALPRRRSPFVVARASSTLALCSQGFAGTAAGGRAGQQSRTRAHTLDTRRHGPSRLPGDRHAALALARTWRRARGAGAARLDVRARHVLQLPHDALRLPVDGHLGQACAAAAPSARRRAPRRRPATASAPRNRAACQLWCRHSGAASGQPGCGCDQPVAGLRARHVDERQVGHVGRVHRQLDGLRRHCLALALQVPPGLRLDLVSDCVCARTRPSGAAPPVARREPLLTTRTAAAALTDRQQAVPARAAGGRRPRRSRGSSRHWEAPARGSARTKAVHLLAVVVQELAVLACARVVQVHELQHERAARDDPRAARQEVLADHRLQHRALARALRTRRNAVRSREPLPQRASATTASADAAASQRGRTWPPMTTMLGSRSHRLGSDLSPALAALSPSSVAALCSRFTSCTTLSIARACTSVGSRTRRRYTAGSGPALGAQMRSCAGPPAAILHGRPGPLQRARGCAGPPGALLHSWRWPLSARKGGLARSWANHRGRRGWLAVNLLRTRLPISGAPGALQHFCLPAGHASPAAGWLAQRCLLSESLRALSKGLKRKQRCRTWSFPCRPETGRVVD